MVDNGEYYRSFPEWAKAQLKKRSMLQKQLAIDAKLNECTLSRWITGNRDIPLKSLIKIANCFGCHIEFVPNEVDML